MKILLSVIFGFLVTSSGLASENATKYKNCIDDAVRLAKRSSELQRIVKADQDDRENWEEVFRNPRHATRLQRRDEARRREVAEIFGEGCFKDAKDYSAAALVYQHGNTADRYYQAFILVQEGI